jgi:hypothetical protein
VCFCRKSPKKKKNARIIPLPGDCGRLCPEAVAVYLCWPACDSGHYELSNFDASYRM